MILDALGVSLVAVACRAIYPAEFNALLRQGLNKSDILSRTTLALAASLRTKANAEPALIWCDRHGGRKHYSALVAQHFGGTLVQTLAETPARSAYRVPAQAKADPTHAKADLNQAQAANLDIEFNVGGESQVPVAVASMTAKYIRELAMHAFNAFWSSRSPGLNPTAGYPADALRWRCDARDAIAEAGVRDKDLWRSV
jgi:ribonuclease HII